MNYIGMPNLSAFCARAARGEPVYISTSNVADGPYSEQVIVKATQVIDKDNYIYLVIVAGTISTIATTRTDLNVFAKAKEIDRAIRKKLSDYPLYNGFISLPSNLVILYGEL